MSLELHPALVRPSHRRLVLVAGGSLLCATVGAMLMAAVAHPSTSAPSACALLEPAVATPPVVIVVPAPVVFEGAPAPVPAAATLVLRAAGHSYLALADLAEAAEVTPHHGKATLADDDGVITATAVVAPVAVPLAYRAWLGQRVVVDEACEATVTGFAVVARLTGDLGYAGPADGPADGLWTAARVMEHGGRVLAARLDGCTGTLARAATAPPVTVLAPVASDALAAQARAVLLASPEALAAQAEWASYERTSAWTTAEGIESTVLVGRHPRTGATFVSVQLRHGEGCGGPNINLWGLYRVDGPALVPLAADRGAIEVVERLVDVEGDGQLEVIGRTWAGTGVVLARAAGTPLGTLEVPFYGCSC